MVRECYTAIIERGRTFTGKLTTEPYECGWASEAIFFVRKLEGKDSVARTRLRVQISPDGMHWCDEGTYLVLTEEEIDFCRVTHFGNWLRLCGTLPSGTSLKAVIALVLKE
ncbi:MAG: hypothetical protein H5T69_20275 [Chloroflexi bacterium]|nr:hypothetical protein [Chloroflexota bacterium]